MRITKSIALFYIRIILFWLPCWLHLISSQIYAEPHLDLDKIVDNGKIASETSNVNFINDNSKVVFYEVTGDHCNDLVGALFLSDKMKAFLSHWECQGGTPYIGEIFTYDVDGDMKDELVVQCIWENIHRAVGINAKYYMIHVYDDKIETSSNRVMMSERIMNEFETGFDGTVNYESSVYKYKTKSSIIKRLEYLNQIFSLSNDRFFKTILRNAYKKALRHYRSKEYYDSVVSLGRTFNKRGIHTEYPAMYRKEYITILNDYAFFIFEYYKKTTLEYCKNPGYTYREDRDKFRKENMEKAKKILEYVLKLSPERIVAYLNLADVLNELDSDARADVMYTKYRTMMTESAKKKIPLRVEDPSKRIKIYKCANSTINTGTSGPQ